MDRAAGLDQQPSSTALATPTPLRGEIGEPANQARGMARGIVSWRLINGAALFVAHASVKGRTAGGELHGRSTVAVGVGWQFAIGNFSAPEA